MLVQLGEKGVKTLDDLADLAGDELIEIVGEGRDGRRHCERGDHGGAGALVRRLRMPTEQEASGAGGRAMHRRAVQRQLNSRARGDPSPRTPLPEGAEGADDREGNRGRYPALHRHARECESGNAR